MSILGNKVINSSSRRIKTNNNQELKINLRQIINFEFLIIDNIRIHVKINRKYRKNFFSRTFFSRKIKLNIYSEKIIIF